MELLLLLIGVYYSAKSRFFPIRHLNRALRSLFSKKEDSENGISVFSGLCTNLAATIGTGNIIGVAAAVMTGGAGALFWMVIAAVVGMATKCVENMLAVRYRSRGADGTWTGGPFLYIRHGLDRKYAFLAPLFAVSCLISGAFGMGTMTQSNSICLALQEYFDLGDVFVLGRAIPASAVAVSVFVTALAAVVILGGGKRIARVAESMIPAMTIAYIVMCAVILFRFRGEISAAFCRIFRDAFSLRAAGGALTGVGMKTAVMTGLRRGVFSNEAGLGTSPIAAAASDGTATEQGYAGIVSVFIDTVVLCTLTGLCVLVTDAAEEAATGVEAAVNTFVWGLPLPATVSKLIFSLFLSVFAFSTILGWNFYAEQCARWLFQNKRAVTAYQYFYLAAVFLGPFLSADFAWLAADVTNVFMAIPNLVALWLLRKEGVGMMQ